MKRNNFCTLFDSNYLTRGLVLYHSLENVCNDFHLYIFAFDEKCFSILNKLNLKHATIISLRQFEDDKLLKVKPTRTIAEYCWTSTSSTILYVLNNFKTETCTYLDADLYFYKSPEIIFDEFKNSSILLTEHRYSKNYDKSRKAGKYCVQYITFKNNDDGLTALKWWRDKCIEWCFNRIEDGKFGDQKYLDDWLERFKGVHVLQNLGGGVAAWNVQQYKVQNSQLELTIIDFNKNEYPVIFYHFHYLRFLENNLIELGRRKLSEDVLSLIYAPYIRELEKTKNIISEIDNSFDSNGTTKNSFTLKTPLIYFWRKLRGTYNIFPTSKFI
ncbi:MAG: glycosyl transferase [Bacteroidetes bacterium]|nr:glycosyl transferase [Bacteroidota bacterium]